MHKEKRQADVNAIFMLMANRVDEQQMALIRAAYEFARESHEDVVPYITEQQNSLSQNSELKQKIVL